jgi:hypothetical protein
MSVSNLNSLVCGNEDPKITLHCLEQYSDVNDFPLDEHYEDFFKTTHSETKDKKYPNLMKLLALLRIANKGLITALKFSGTFNSDQKEIRNCQSVLEDLRLALRDIWNSLDDLNTVHLLKRFLQFSKHFKDPDLRPVILSCLVILQNLVEALIDKIEKGSPEDLEKYENWVKSVSSQIEKIIQSDPFKGVVASAVGAGVFVIGANLGLSILGFTATGVQAGSIAAAWMSSIGNGYF